ncbi:30S ribosomal protein S2 [Candidatus Actinomarina sp.]|jgi:small subunit ribosomal protein S2|nr:30S ribosomal protein S2 [Acidimicrobiia bacterium]MDA7850631.1 30S ribosomal protein S2 [Acidimicrobiaceae bacterium]MDA8710179.1 30S ribosomal protein S2 [Candidatus Actinomarina sp.]MDA7548103.1 30S ribosomal protein S2 [Acidimicrobiia bacterium]MDA7594781.1 30S ribosomal protein S2 [Acidimicrobiia bacterium]|tara:strand:+ start:170 stop:880 length:711 start_codon:yes stop_codon:yes gene_type:complete
MSTNMKELLEAGVHFGHQTQRWNPKMDNYIYGDKSGIHILDLRITYDAIAEAEDFVQKIVANGGKVLFVGTKPQAQNVIQVQAESAGMPFVNHRWLGGMLTNFKTIIKRVIYLKELISLEDSGEINAYPKPERLRIRREVTKLTRSIGGIVNLSKIPDAIFIVDLMNESTALTEANKLGIPVIGLADSNVDPTGVDIVIPGNDDAIRSIEVVTSAIAEACAKGAGLEAIKAEKEGE